jgi:RNA polymerase sigma-70 factor (ECF subfamily)
VGVTPRPGPSGGGPAADDDPTAGPQPCDPGLLELYDRALPQVYGYLLARCGSRATAEDLTAETFLAAVTAVREDHRAVPTVGWLLGVARHKLVDHWRREARRARTLTLAHDEHGPPDDPWDAEVDAIALRAALHDLGPHHRLALVLRYVDGLPVHEVAGHLGRTPKATEGLLRRARAALRARYEASGTSTRGEGGDA